MSIKIACVPFNPTMGDISLNRQNIVRFCESLESSYDLLIFPECALSGYNLRDLFFYKPFITQIEQELQVLCRELSHCNIAIILGTPRLIKNPEQFDMQYPQIASNNVLLIDKGKIIFERAKYNLPLNDVFDDIRNFAKPQKMGSIVEWRGVRLGLLICEEIWHNEVSETMQESGAQCLIVVNASPFDAQKAETRLQAVLLQAKLNKLPIIYCNMLAGCDDVVYDGGAFILNAKGELVGQSAQFATEILAAEIAIINDEIEISSNNLSPHPSQNLAIYQAMMLGLRDYMRKNGFKKIMLGLSGGVDSALSAIVAADALGTDKVFAYGLPSRYSSQGSIDDAQVLANDLGINFQIIPIEPLHLAGIETIAKVRPEATQGLAFENIQARIRGLILMTLSNIDGALLLTTGNKSELSVGYSTLYGDSCGGYSVIKDLYKTQVYEICEFRNQHAGQFGFLNAKIPQNTLTKAPSAELRPNQTDQDSLPNYDDLDASLKMIIENFGEDASDHLLYRQSYKLLRQSEYKRLQSATGVKLSTRAFGVGWRMPTTHQFKG